MKHSQSYIILLVFLDLQPQVRAHLRQSAIGRTFRELQRYESASKQE